MHNGLNTGLSIIVLLGLVAIMTMLSPDWTIALVPVCIVAVICLNLDPLIALLNGPYDSGDR